MSRSVIDQKEDVATFSAHLTIGFVQLFLKYLARHLDLLVRPIQEAKFRVRLLLEAAGFVDVPQNGRSRQRWW